MTTSRACHIRQTMLLLMTAAMLFVQSQAGEPVAGEKVVPHQRISVKDYQNFIGNWDEKKVPVLCALIQSPGQYDAVFHPAAVMRNKTPFAPDKGLYDKEQIVVVARVMTAPADMEKAFEVDKIIESGGDLMIYYRFIDAKSDATYTVKNFLALRLPKREYKRVLFLESGKQVGELKPSEGAWCNLKLEVQ